MDKYVRRPKLETPNDRYLDRRRRRDRWAHAPQHLGIMLLVGLLAALPSFLGYGLLLTCLLVPWALTGVWGSR